MNARTIILIGAPGAGKTCQATALAQALPAKSVSPGQMLRDLKGQSVIGQYMQQFFVREALADIAWELIEREIVSAKNAGSSIVLEGTPREAKDTFLLQKKLFKNGLSNNLYVVLLNISAQDLANRNKIPRAGREAENMAARHQTFNEETGPLLKALQDQGLTPIHVDANGTPEEVTKKILDAIKGPGVEWKIDNVVERPTDIDAELNLVAEKCNAIENAECIMRLIGHSSTEDDKKRDAGQKRQPKFPGSHCNGLQPCHMDPQNRDAVNFRDYCVTPKADGTRYLVVVVHNTSGLWLKLIDRNLHAHACFAPENKREGKEDGPGRMENVVTILDAELVRAKDSHAMLLVFDCLCVRNKCIVNHPLQHRVEEARSLVAELRKAGYSSSTRSQVVDVVMKAYEDAGSITADQFDGLLQADAFQFGSDGLILTPKGRYHLGFDRRLLKWKPLQEFTADFRVKKVGGPVVDPNNSAVQCVLMELFVMQGNGAEGSFGSHDNYGYLTASETVARDIEQKVVELSWDSEVGPFVSFTSLFLFFLYLVNFFGLFLVYF